MAISANSQGTFKQDTSAVHQNPSSRSAIQWLFSPGFPDATPEELDDLKQRALTELEAEKNVETPQVRVCLPIQIVRQVTHLHGVLEKRKVEKLRTSDGSELSTVADVDRLVDEIRRHRAKTGPMGEEDIYLQLLSDHAKDQCGKAPAEPSHPRPVSEHEREVFMTFLKSMDDKSPRSTAKKRNGNNKVREPTKAESDKRQHTAKVARALGVPDESRDSVRAEARVRRGEFLVSPRAEIELDAAAQEVLSRELELRAMKQKLSPDMRAKVNEALARTPSRPTTPSKTEKSSTPEC